MPPVSEQPEPKETEAAGPDSQPAGPGALEDSLLALLRGIQEHLPAAPGSDGQEFRSGLAALEKQFAGKDNAGRIVASTIEILNKYNQSVGPRNARIGEAASELARAIQTLPKIQGNAERWNRVEEQIKAISSGDDLEVMKARLCAEVAVARAEALQERQNIGTLFAGILTRLDVEPDEASATVVHRVDELTGLLSRDFAERELTKLHGQSPDCFLALFIVKRLALINARFGYSRGDEVLLKVVMHLAQLLPDFRTVFRWAPCSFLALAPPNTSYKELRSKVQIVEVARLTPTLEWEGRSAMVPVAMDCRIVSIKDFGTPFDLFMRLDTLASDG
jgi:GGDEF domain-containing protein